MQIHQLRCSRETTCIVDTHVKQPGILGTKPSSTDGLVWAQLYGGDFVGKKPLKNPTWEQGHHPGGFQTFLLLGHVAELPRWRFLAESPRSSTAGNRSPIRFPVGWGLSAHSSIWANFELGVDEKVSSMNTPLANFLEWFCEEEFPWWIVILHKILASIQ